MRCLYSGLGVTIWRFVKDVELGKVLRDAQEQQDVHQNRA